MADIIKNVGTAHSVSMSDRKKLELTGVTEVISFDETAVVLRTQLGTLEVQGQELQLKTLSIDGGQVAVDGLVVSLRSKSDLTTIFSYDGLRRRVSVTDPPVESNVTVQVTGVQPA